MIPARPRHDLGAHAEDRSHLTPTGAALLAAELADIRDRRLPELRPLMWAEDRDERTVAHFEDLIARADSLDVLLGCAVIIKLDPTQSDPRVRLGTRVKVRLVDGSSAWVRPVDPVEAALDSERISVLAPLGAALLGCAKGARVEVAAPMGTWTCIVLAVDVTDELHSGAIARPARVTR